MKKSENDVNSISIIKRYCMLQMVEKGIRGGICRAIYRYAKANSKYMKGFNQNKESSYLIYWDANNLQGQKMSQNLTVNNFS